MSIVRVRSCLPRMVATAFVAAAVSGLVGCDQVSDETKAAAADAAICSQIEAEPAEIENNPETARLVALLVRDLAPDENISAIAAQIAEDPTLLDPRAKLAQWVEEKCGR